MRKSYRVVLGALVALSCVESAIAQNNNCGAVVTLQKVVQDTQPAGPSLTAWTFFFVVKTNGRSTGTFTYTYLDSTGTLQTKTNMGWTNDGGAADIITFDTLPLIQ